MGLNLQSKKITFFDRLKVAIFKLEEYGMFLGERPATAFKYFFILVLLVSVIMTFATTYDFSKMVNKTHSYIQNELPEFIYDEGKIKFTENVNAYDKEYKFRLIINTDDIIDENLLKDYKNEIAEFGIIFLQDKAIFISDGTQLEKRYSEISDYYQFGINNKNDLENTLNSNINKLIGTYFIVDFIGTYIGNIVSIFLDICVVAIFGWFACRFCGMKFRISIVMSLAIYSLSLSIVLSCAYSVAYVFTNFYIQNFNVIYLLISYVYIIAAIFMIKYDLIRQNEELQKILEEQKKIREEKAKENKEENKEESKEENKDNKDNKENNKDEEEPVIEVNKEPDGSEI